VRRLHDRPVLARPIVAERQERPRTRLRGGRVGAGPAAVPCGTSTNRGQCGPTTVAHVGGGERRRHQHGAGGGERAAHHEAAPRRRGSPSSGCSHGRSCAVAMVGHGARSGTAATELCSRSARSGAAAAAGRVAAAPRRAALARRRRRERRGGGAGWQQQHRVAGEQRRVGGERRSGTRAPTPVIGPSPQQAPSKAIFMRPPAQ
jgi:hypothetical protein